MNHEANSTSRLMGLEDVGKLFSLISELCDDYLSLREGNESAPIEDDTAEIGEHILQFCSPDERDAVQRFIWKEAYPTGTENCVHCCNGKCAIGKPYNPHKYCERYYYCHDCKEK